LGAKQLFQVVLSGLRRIAATGVAQGPRFSVLVEELKEEPYAKNDRAVRAYCQELLASLRELTSYERSYGQQILLLAEQVDSTNPAELADLVAAIVCKRDEAQLVLEELDVKKRLRLSMSYLKVELETNKIRHQIARDVDKNFQETQRKYVLREQLSLIQKELGITVDERSALVEKYNKRLLGLVVPEHAKKVIDEELARVTTQREK
jgi:ATP-dependent Lon protease